MQTTRCTPRRFGATLGFGATLAATLGVASLLATLAVAASAEDGVQAPSDGIWEIQGTTTVTVTGDVRQAYGRVVLARARDGYATTFNLQTSVLTPEGSRKVDITGSGTGSLQAGVLQGQTESQWLMAAIPGLDPQFAFIPGRLGPRIVSTFEMRPISGSDDYQIEITSVGVAGDAGQNYAPTVSTFRAQRVGDTPVDRKLPLPARHAD